MDNPNLSSNNLHLSQHWLNKVQLFLSAIVRYVGLSIAWLTIAMAALTTAVVIMRYGLSLGGIAVQESIIYMHAAVFMLAAAYTLQTDGHVRVDVFYRKFSKRTRIWVDLLGTLVLLFPTSIFIIYICWDYTSVSWRIGERSQEASGLPIVYILKSLLIVMPLLLIMQALANTLSYINELFLNKVPSATENEDPAR